MAKTEQELKELKKKIERLSERLKSLSYEELAQVSGGEFEPRAAPGIEPRPGVQAVLE